MWEKDETRYGNTCEALLFLLQFSHSQEFASQAIPWFLKDISKQNFPLTLFSLLIPDEMRLKLVIFKHL